MKYLLLLILAFPVMATERHDHSHDPIAGPKGDTGAQGNIGPQGPSGVNASTLYKGVAAALASSQHQFGFYTPKYQWSIATGQFDNEQAFQQV